MLTVYAGGRTGPEGSHRPWSPQEIRHWPVRRDLGGAGCVCPGSPCPSAGQPDTQKVPKTNTFELASRSLRKRRTNCREGAGD